MIKKAADVAGIVFPRLRGVEALAIIVVPLVVAPVAAQPALSSDGDYRVEYSQIVFGSGSAQTDDYQVEDTIKIATAVPTEQGSEDYDVVNVIEPDANNGLAIGQGTTMNLYWAGAMPPGADGFNIFRSDSVTTLEFQQINPAPVTGNTYQDTGLAPGDYNYIVYCAFSDGSSEQWTEVFGGTIAAPTASPTPTPSASPLPSPTPTPYVPSEALWQLY